MIFLLVFFSQVAGHFPRYDEYKIMGGDQDRKNGKARVESKALLPIGRTFTRSSTLTANVPDTAKQHPSTGPSKKLEKEKFYSGNKILDETNRVRDTFPKVVGVLPPTVRKDNDKSESDSEKFWLRHREIFPSQKILLSMPKIFFKFWTKVPKKTQSERCSHRFRYTSAHNVFQLIGIPRVSGIYNGATLGIFIDRRKGVKDVF